MKQEKHIHRTRILMVTPLFPPRYSGSTMQALNLSRAMSGECDISFLALTDEKAEMRGINGFPVHYVYEKNIDKVISGQSVKVIYPLILKIFLQLFQLRRSYDLIHCHTTAFPFSTISVFGRLLKKKTIMKNSLFGEIDWKRVGRISGRIHRRALKMTDCFVAISSEIGGSLHASGIPENNLRYITNGVDCNHFKPISGEARLCGRKRMGFNPKNPVIVFVGAICARKGVLELVFQWPSILNALPEAKLLLIGPSGKDHKEFARETTQTRIEDFIQRMGLDQSILMIGNVSNINEYLQISDLLILLSKNEGMPNVVLEAMACGVPCIASNVSGIRDIIDSGQNGYILQANEDLCKTVVRYFQLEDTNSFREKAVQRIRSKFSLSKIKNQYIKLYKELKDT
jgi:glycosyltransferase involved in cell wall biosynthesis